MRTRLALSAVFGLLLIWSCHLAPADSKDHFEVVGDSAWLKCDSVLVVLKDGDGEPLDTLFNDSLRFLSQLKRLSADKYKGGEATLSISGRKDGGSCFEQNRSFDENGTVAVDTVLAPGTRPQSVSADPESFSIMLGDMQSVQGAIAPAYADQSLLWNLEGDGVVSLVYPALGGSGRVTVRGEKIGATVIVLRSAVDPTKSFEIRVRVTAPPGNSVSLDRDSMTLFLGGAGDTLAAEVIPSDADQKVEWKSLNPAVVSVDANGHVAPVGEGQTYVQAKSLSTLQYASSWITVKRDVPKLTLRSKGGAAINTDIAITPRAVQEYGIIELLLWDLNGDGEWDDSRPGPWNELDAELPPVIARYTKEGLYTARFAVRDGEGNLAEAEVVLDIGNQAPEITAIRSDTVISIGDSIAMTASVRDVDGEVAWTGWDYEGDGVYDDSLSGSDPKVEVVLGHRYPDAGNYLAVFEARDAFGKARKDTVKVKVELDRPVADAGGDTTVTVESDLYIHARGADKFGLIVKREARLPGESGFRVLSGPDTTIEAPENPGTYAVLVRVTDDDGLVGMDSSLVTVALSADADLAGLVFSAKALDPAFKPYISYYSAQVGYGDSSVTVTPTAKDPDSKITVNALTVASGAASKPVKLAVGSNLNAFQIVVTSADGTQRLYTLSVLRDPSADATLGKLDVTGFALKPAFAPSKVAYADTVANAVAFVTFKPTLAISTGSLTLNDSAMASGSASFPMPLKVGENLFEIKVTSQSGASKTVYKIKILRRTLVVLARSLDGKPTVAVDSSEAIPGAPMQIGVAPVAGYHFVKWTLLEGAAAILDPEANQTVLTPGPVKVLAQAAFVLNKYTLTASAGAGGTITPASVTVDSLGGQEFAVTVAPGYRVSVLLDNGVDVTKSLLNNKYTLAKIDKPHTLSLACKRVFTVTVTATGPGSVSPGTVTLDSLASQTFSLQPLPDCKIVSVQLDGAPAAIASSVAITSIKANRTLAVVFRRTFAFTTTIKGSGAIEPAKATVDSGSDTTLLVKPGAGWRTSSLVVDGTAIAPTASIAFPKVNRNHAVDAVFTRFFHLTAGVAAGSGTITPASADVDTGGSQTFQLNPAANYRVSGIMVNGIDQRISPTAVQFVQAGIDRNYDIKVSYLRQYKVTTATDGRGSAVASLALADSGLQNSSTITLTPKSNYRLDSLFDNGVPVLPAAGGDLWGVQTYVLSGIQADHAVRAVFKRFYQVSVKVSGEGAFTPETANVDSLGSQTFTGRPAAGWYLSSLLDNKVEVKPTGNDYSLSKVVGNHDLSVIFTQGRLITITLTTNASPEVRRQPTLCIEYSESNQVCKAGSNSATVPIGSTVVISADQEWCGSDLECKQPWTFDGWQASKAVVRENPYKFSAENNVSVQATYVEGVVAF